MVGLKVLRRNTLAKYGGVYCSSMRMETNHDQRRWVLIARPDPSSSGVYRYVLRKENSGGTVADTRLGFSDLVIKQILSKVFDTSMVNVVC